MRKAFSVVVSVLLFAASVAKAESTWEFSVQVSATVQQSPAQITLSWPQDSYMQPNSYTIYRKAQSDNAWGPGTTLPGTATNFSDRNVTLGTGYEYQVVKSTSQYTGYGYIYSGINLPLVDNRGTMLLVVDNTVAGGLSSELARLQHDLVGDGWVVNRLDVSRTDSPLNVKNQIRTRYLADPGNVKAVFLFGHVPVPYSGNIVPDGHVPDHQGAWPCDAFYGDMDGTWTDSSVNTTSASDARNRNVPGDGKFDQSSLPAPVKLMVGRVDLANMPGRLTWGGPATFPSEIELLRNYLNKDHKFRHKQFDLPRRAYIGDFFGNRGGEAFVASGWRNFSGFFGANKLTNLPEQGSWVTTLASNPALAAYGCGAGSYTSIGGLGNSGPYRDVVTTEIVSNDVKTVFALLFGSWLGDWDSEDNILRSILALPSYGLASAWSGRPHWFLQHMAMGETLGFGARLTQNNPAGGLYQNQLNSCAGQTHIALMGDPSLRLHVVAPPSSVTSSGGSVQWSASTDQVVGYHVYSASSANGPFTRLTTTPVAGTSYADSTGGPGKTYMVRAVKLETSGSGTYYNASQGVFANGTSDGSNGGSSGSNTNSTGTGGSTGGTSTNSTSTPAAVTGSVWVDDMLPSAAVPGSDGGDGWNWVSNTPSPVSGRLAHRSSAATGQHQHYFSMSDRPMNVKAGDTLFAYVYLDPTSVPSELMLQWNDGTWEHRAYWGSDLVSYGTPGTAGHRYMGAMPAAGQWTRLQVPASVVGLEGSAVNGMAFTLYNGGATWDAAGVSSAGSTTPGSTNTVPPTSGTTSTNGNAMDETWVDDVLPSSAVPGTDGGDSWNWISADPAPQSGRLAHQSSVGAGLHQHFFTSASQTLTVNTGDVLYAYVHLDPANKPKEVMLQWNDGSWEHRAYWGLDLIDYGTAGSGRRYMGPLPATGQWVRLQVPASQVGLEGKTLNGMAFSVYDGRAVWDNAGKTPAPGSTNPGTTNTVPGGTNTVPGGTNTVPATNDGVSFSTNAIPGVSVLDGLTPQLPGIGSNTLRVLTPTLLELVLVNTKQPDPAQVSCWNLVDGNSRFTAPPLNDFAVTANGSPVSVASVGFKRVPLYASLAGYDLRIGNHLYLKLAAPLTDRQVIEVKNPNGSLWASSMKFIASVDPLRYSPAIHVNQEGYMPNYSKKAMVGYYAGDMGEMDIPASGGFTIVDATTGQQVHQGSLVPRLDKGYTYTPTPYQKVYEADFTSFNAPGEYRLLVPGLGGSVAFLINDGIAMSFARAYALGLYHQRCGTNTGMPYTRFNHDVCHHAPAAVPMPAESYSFTWNTIAGYANTRNANNPPQSAPALTSPSAQLFPFVKQGTLDVSGGHHDAGDYSKYTANSASLVHYLVFSADSLGGAGALDNLGIPESGDGISDLLQEAKWEADFLAKLQDDDGGFYFLVYPKEREYESNVSPDKGDPQVVWPKTTAVTAASVAALAQCASSPAFKRAFPQAAAVYLQKAQKGWKFLTDAIAKYGKNGVYQKITHYADDFTDNDELAWAACEMFLATGDPAIHQLLQTWFDPADPATWRWGWWHMSQCWGHAIRSYAFAVRSGRVASAGSLNAAYLAKCNAEIAAAADDILKFSDQNAYGTGFPLETKAVKTAGWYFSLDQAFDLAVGYQLNQKPDYMKAMLANMNYEGGCNPVNVTFVTGLGWKRQRDVVSQWALNDSRVLPPSGTPVGNVFASFGWLWNYAGQLQALCYPSFGAATAPFPMYDRWGDSWNVSAEFVVLNQARGLGTVAFLAAQGPCKTQEWKPVAGKLTVPGGVVPVGSNITVTLQAPGIDLSAARITWEARDQEPAYGPSFSFSPKNNGTQWVEAEAQLPDGRRVFAATNINANAPNIVWVDDTAPTGATTGGDGGDSWNWVGASPAAYSGTLSHQSTVASGPHQHYFVGATSTLEIGTGDVLYAWVYLDPANPPTEIMLQWNDGTWDHRAYWGANVLGYGVDGTPGRRSMGALPLAGQWVQLKVPASQVNLEGRTVNGMAFSLNDGRAWWDAAGRLSQEGSAAAMVAVSATNAEASRLSSTAGEVTFLRTGSTNTPLAIAYSLGGDALEGLDYQAAQAVTIPAGASSATLKIVPLATTNFVATRTVVVNVKSTASYRAGENDTATVELGGNILHGNLAMTGQGPTMRWDSTINRKYRIAYKNDLNEPAWTAAEDITAQSRTSTWVDRNAAAAKRRFYLVAQVD